MIRLKFDCVDRRIRKLFYTYGVFVGRHYWVILTIPVVLTLIFGCGFLYSHEIADVQYLNTPDDAPSLIERQNILKNWPDFADTTNDFSPGINVNGDGFCQIIVTAKDGGNVLRFLHLSEMINLNDFVSTKLASNDDDGKKIGYEDVCMRFNGECYSNQEISGVGYLLASVDMTNDTLTYPWFSFNGKKRYIGDVLGGVTTNNESLMTSAKAWLLSYQLKISAANASETSWPSKWRNAFVTQLLNFNSQLVNVAVFHSATMNEEINGYTDQLPVIYVICLVALVLCLATFSLVTLPKIHFTDWSSSKPWVSVGGVVALCMAIPSAFGLLHFMNISFNEILFVVPFFMIPIIYQQISIILNTFWFTDRSLASEKRMSHSLRFAGVANLITLIEDIIILSFSSFLSTPGVQLFCIYMCFSIVFVFIYVHTFFVGLLALSVPFERRGKHSLCCWVDTKEMVHEEEEEKETKCWSQLFFLGSRDKEETSVGPINNFFQTKYASFLTHTICKICIFLVLILIVCSAGYGCTLYSSGVEIEDLVSSGSYAKTYLGQLKNFFWSSGVRMQVVVNEAPDLSVSSLRQEIDRLFVDFANSSVTNGVNSAEFWLRQFKKFSPNALNQNATSAYFYKEIRRFFADKDHRHFLHDVTFGDIKFAQNPEFIVAFRFSLGLKSMSTLADQTNTVSIVRNIAAKYDKFNVTCFAPQFLTVDQTLMAPWNGCVTLIAQLVSFSLITLFLIPHSAVAICLIFSCTIVGLVLLSAANFLNTSVNSFSTYILIGSFVLSTHYNLYFAYAYCSLDSGNSLERLKHALKYTAYPLVQCFLSTIICVSVLSTYDFYVIQIVFRGIILVTAINLIYSIVFLPVLLSIFVSCGCYFPKKENQQEISNIRPMDQGANEVKPETNNKEEGVDDDDELAMYPPIKLPRISFASCDNNINSRSTNLTYVKRRLSCTWPVSKPSDDNVSTHKRFMEPLPDDLCVSPQPTQLRNVSTQGVRHLGSVSSADIPSADSGPNEVFVEVRPFASFPRVNIPRRPTSVISEHRLDPLPESKHDYVDVVQVVVPKSPSQNNKISPASRQRLFGQRLNSAAEPKTVCYENELY